MVFYPSLGLFAPRMAFLYRADGGTPRLPNGHLPTAIAGEPLGGNWYRVVEQAW